MNRLTEPVPGPAGAPLFSLGGGGAASPAGAPASSGPAPIVQVGDLSSPDTPVGQGASGLKLTNPFAPDQAVTISSPEKPAGEGAAAPAGETAETVAQKAAEEGTPVASQPLAQEGAVAATP